MKLSPKKRWALLLSLLATSVASAIMAPNEGEDKTGAAAHKPAPERHRETHAATSPAELQLEPLQRSAAAESESANENERDIFPRQSWYVAPPPPKPVAPPPPAPPPLPFTVLGKMLENGQPQVFLNKQERTMVVREGDVIEGTYRVESILAPTMTLTYLPLNMQQTISIGAFN